MASTSDFKNGMCIRHNNDLWVLIEFQHVKPGKGPAFVRTKLRNIKTGRVLDNTFTAGVKIEQVRVERRQYQFLYKDGTDYHVMNSETYEQIMLQENQLNAPQFLKDGDMIEVQVHAEDEEVLTATVPPTVELEVTYTEPGVKGDTATNTLKPATVETGAEVRVPLFINTGDKIKVQTETGTYSERVRD